MSSKNFDYSFVRQTLLFWKEINGWDRDRVKGFLQAVLGLGGNVIDVIYDQEVSGKAFLHLNEEQLTRNPSPFRLKYGPASAIAELVEQIKGEQPIADKNLRIDYGKLLKLIINDREVGSMPYLVGSRPPSYDSRKYIEKAGSEVETFDRGRQNHEKEVDSEMRMGNACAVTQASLQNEPDTIVLVSGDKGMRPGIKRALN
ncbi:hypothetical protein RhiirA1_470887 [Rhizophagus irregularis]|uniref:Uncharacterized protein n=1 Tax=Rhizophagus irregularis TaxID=588596 RepID=A0A2I1ESR0_9GLOM|nr:hypothetical protein RhiirA1_470887 [Rhizophagus irregularis]PKY25170.1 hypothetical protein RhiirB3_439991 [Rhizophagus irregularis]